MPEDSTLDAFRTAVSIAVGKARASRDGEAEISSDRLAELVDMLTEQHAQTSSTAFSPHS